jgi:hypothetical protein
MLRLIKQHIAKRKLQRMIDEARKAPATVEFRRRREAALKATRV